MIESNLDTIISGLATIIITVTSISLRMVWVKIKNHWKKQDQIHELNRIKLDSVIYSLSTFNNGVSAKFKVAYEERYQELVNESDFINKQ